MPDLDASNYLRDEQYRDASNLTTRIALHTRFGTNPVPWTTWVFDQFRLPAAGRILELGTGPAGLWRANLERIPHGWDITLSDFSPGMLEDAQRNLGAYESRFHYQVIDAQTIPFADRVFDGVIANHMLYHMPDRPKAFSEIARVLKPRGVLYASTIGVRHMHEVDELLERAHPDVPVKRRFFQATEGFTLENGPEQLKQYFAAVAMRRYKNVLQVTVAEPLVDYIFSGVRARAPMPYRERVAQMVARELAVHGAITISGDTGMFQAIKA
jgi:ubiquinone/menaquinone biosynthesis C-methylase UbiE